MSSSFLETIQAVEQPPGDCKEEHRDTEIKEIHLESPVLLITRVPLATSKRYQN